MKNWFTQKPLCFLANIGLNRHISLALILSLAGALAHAENTSFAILSAAKKLPSGHSIIAVAGNLHEEFEGRIAYLGVAKKTASDVVWKIGYFGYYPKQEDGSRTEDHRLRGALSYTFKFDDWRLMHRSRLEYRMGQIPNGFRYRPAFELSRPLMINNIKIIPYAEVEPFYDFHQNQLSLTLFTAGIKWPINPTFTLNIGHFNIFLNEANTHTKGPQVWLHIKL